MSMSKVQFVNMKLSVKFYVNQEYSSLRSFSMGKKDRIVKFLIFGYSLKKECLRVEGFSSG